ncbi:MAG: ThiF family adenylyltransferase [Theionarchaea archaeon]|nr:ThiF family adenylyltransferase [Theionarchaea archaeon]
MSEKKEKAQELVKVVVDALEKDSKTNIDLSEILPLVEDAVSELEKKNWERAIELALRAKDRLKITRMTVYDQWNQKKMEKTTIFVAGVGALGCEIAKNLILMGTGRVILCDYDDIELSNVSRQMLFRDEDIGKKKADVAQKCLLRMNEFTSVEAYSQKIQELPGTVYEECDVLVSCLDSFVPRRFLNSVSVSLEKPFVDGGIEGLQGVVYAFHPPQTACRECNPMMAREERKAFCTLLGEARRKALGLTRDGKDPEEELDFSEYIQREQTKKIPTFMSTTAIIAGIQTQEVVKIIQGIGKPLYGKALFYLGEGNDQGVLFSTIPLAKNPLCPACSEVGKSEKIIESAHPSELFDQFLDRINTRYAYPDMLLFKHGMVLFDGESILRGESQYLSNLKRSLEELGIQNGDSLLLVTQQRMNPITITVHY